MSAPAPDLVERVRARLAIHAVDLGVRAEIREEPRLDRMFLSADAGPPWQWRGEVRDDGGDGGHELVAGAREPELLGQRLVAVEEVAQGPHPRAR